MKTLLLGGYVMLGEAPYSCFVITEKGRDLILDGPIGSP